MTAPTWFMLRPQKRRKFSSPHSSSIFTASIYCVYRATKLGMYPHLEGLRRDVREFYSLPIPSQVWERMKSFQDRDFVSFVEDALRT